MPKALYSFCVPVGFILICAALPLAAAIPSDFIRIANMISASAWLVTWLGTCAKLHWRLDAMTAATLLVITLIPLTNSKSPVSLCQFIATVGLFLLIAGLLHSPLFARSLNKLNLLVNQQLPTWLWIGLFYTVFLALTIFLSGYCFAHLPTVIDTVSQYVHAKFIAQWHWYGKSPALPQFFNSGLMINDGKWYSQYQPLHVLFLGIGQLAGTPWIVNPVLGAVTLVTTYFLARRCAGENVARLSIVLFLFCPLILFMSSEYMNHATALLCTTISLLAAMQLVEAVECNHHTHIKLWAIACGFGLSGLFLTRPLNLLETGIPVAGYLLWQGRKAPPTLIKSLLIIALCLIGCLLFQAWYDSITTGDALLMPYLKYHDTNLPGFDHHHTLLKGLHKAQDEWHDMNQSLFEWPVPCLLFIIPLFAAVPRNRHLNLLLALLVSTTIVNMINRFNSAIFGPRYIYETASTLIVLSAAGIAQLATMLDQRKGASICAIALIALYVGGWSVRMPELLTMYSRPYFDGNPAFYEKMLAQAQEPALVFIERLDQTHAYPFQKYLRVAHTNPPLDNADIIFAIDLGLSEDKKLIEQYPQRNVYIERRSFLYPLNRADMTSDAPNLAY